MKSLFDYDSLRPVLIAAQAGDREAKERLFTTFRLHLRRQARQKRMETIRARGWDSDVAQEALLKAHKDFDTFQGKTPEQFEAWVMAIVDHEAANYRRRYLSTQKRQASREVPLYEENEVPPLASWPEADTRTPPERLIRKELPQDTLGLIEQLPARTRDIARLKSEGLTFAEIGQRIGCTAKAAEQAMRRARRYIKKRLPDWDT